MTAQATALPELESRPLIDGCGRRMDHLRLSVTDRCDMRCCYCRPHSDPQTHARTGDLSDAERLELVAFLYRRYGLRQLRLTGGEPLLHKGIVELVAAIRLRCPNLAIAMTTNGRRLARFAAALRAAGLERLNVSLDALDPRIYRGMTGCAVGDVLDGLAAALAAGFPPPRLNTVVLRDLNAGHLAEMVAELLPRGYVLRFLEAMPIGPAAELNRDRFVAAEEILRQLRAVFKLDFVERAGTAERYRVSGPVTGEIGIIAPVTRPFCAACRRIRVTADGHLFPCLLGAHSVDLRPGIRAGDAGGDPVGRLIEQAVAAKAASGQGFQRRAMITLGG